MKLLKSLYHIYDKKSWVYRTMAKRKAKIRLAFKVVAITIAGSAVAKAIVMPIFVSITEMFAVLIQAHLARIYIAKI